MKKKTPGEIAQGVIKDILSERVRSMKKGHTIKKDDSLTPGHLSLMALCYAFHTASSLVNAPQEDRDDVIEGAWPRQLDTFHPKTPRENLIKAIVLLLAEVERLDRAAQNENT